MGVGVSGEGGGIIYRLDIKSYELQYFTNLFGSFFLVLLSAPLVPRFVFGCVAFCCCCERKDIKTGIKCVEGNNHTHTRPLREREGG